MTGVTSKDLCARRSHGPDVCVPLLAKKKVCCGQAPAADVVEQELREAFMNSSLAQHWLAGEEWAALDYNGLVLSHAAASAHHAKHREVSIPVPVTSPSKCSDTHAAAVLRSVTDALPCPEDCGNCSGGGKNHDADAGVGAHDSEQGAGSCRAADRAAGQGVAAAAVHPAALCFSTHCSAGRGRLRQHRAPADPGEEHPQTALAGSPARNPEPDACLRGGGRLSFSGRGQHEGTHEYGLTAYRLSFQTVDNDKYIST